MMDPYSAELIRLGMTRNREQAQEPQTPDVPWETQAYGTPQEQPEHVTGAGLQEAAKWYANYANENMKRLSLPDMWQPNEEGGYTYHRPKLNDEQLQAMMDTFGGVLGPTRVVKTGLLDRAIEYWPKNKPEPPIGAAESWLHFRLPGVTKGETRPAKFEHVWGSEPTAFGRMLKELSNNLTPAELDAMELTPMLTGAVPQWERLAKSKFTEGLPNLKTRMLNNAKSVREGSYPGEVPERTIGYAKNMEPQDLLELTDRPVRRTIENQLHYQPEGGIYGEGANLLGLIKRNASPATLSEINRRAATGGRFHPSLSERWLNESKNPSPPGEDWANILTTYLRQLATE
jgi:hypothetical protein